MTAASAPGPDYSVPALDKALDILELLAGRSGGLSQAVIADAAGRVLVLAQVESPANFGFSVRVGSEFPIDGTATGAVLAAFADPTDRDGTLADRGLRADSRESRPHPGSRFRTGGRQPPAGDHRHRVSDLRARAAAEKISGALGQ